MSELADKLRRLTQLVEELPEARERETKRYRFFQDMALKESMKGYYSEVMFYLIDTKIGSVIKYGRIDIIESYMRLHGIKKENVWLK